MSETTVTQLPDPSGFTSDPFTDVLRDGARKLIEQAIHMDLSRICAAPSARLGHLALECQGAFPSQC